MARPDVEYLEEASVQELVVYVRELEALIIKWAADCARNCGDSDEYVTEACELGLAD